MEGRSSVFVYSKSICQFIHRIEGGGGGITDRTYQKVFKALRIDYSTLAEIFNKKAAAREKELV